ncbi:Beta-lactamase [uncultured Eubacteriales bacterium]|uniref:Beta-lactamase n=1 Tax=uncultured Eubacteriales bacterium TaxID=172733 RepID=A0A212K438_9FIRM|nr:Beta-lactamase [uncultured Eubacteriales bacterium]
MRQGRKRLLGLLLAAAMTVTIIAPAGAATISQGGAVSLPDAQWQITASFPDWKGYTDDTLAMNSLISFTGFRDQGELYVSVASSVTSFRMFVNNEEVSTSSMQAGKTYQLDISNVAVDGTNTVQVTNILPAGLSKAVTVYAPYPTVIKGAPADVSMDDSTLDIINDFIKTEVKYGFSGAQLAVVKDGKLVISNAWGAENGYNSDGSRIKEGDANYVPVTTDTLYDLASNTKMYSVNYAIQYLVTKGKMDLDTKIVDIIGSKFVDDTIDITYNGYANPGLETNKGWKAGLTIRDILKHQAGFPADPQYHNDKFNQATQKPQADTDNPLYSGSDGTMATRANTLETICKTPLMYQPGTKTLYSDVDYMLLCFVVEQVTGKGLDEFLKEVFWDPMDLTHMTYNPLKNGFTSSQIAATELNGNSRDGAINFTGIREGVIQGTVHDEKAYYAMGGISGHAGLFSNAEDLAKLASVMLSGGYGDLQFFSKNVIDEFTKPKSTDSATWGLGWWREAEAGRNSYFTSHSSTSTVGHQGWTGTLTVIDPERDLVIVLLTNKKNSPVIDNTVDANDFYSDNMALGALGSVVNYVYESMDSTPDAMDASLHQWAIERVKVIKSHEGKYDEAVHMNDAFALVDLMITRAEKRKTSITKTYAQDALDNLQSYVSLYVDSQASKNNAEVWAAELQNRIHAISAKDSSTGTVMTAVQVSSMPGADSGTGDYVGGADQNAVYFPTLSGLSTSGTYQNSISWFEGYEGQGTVYFSIIRPVESLRIFVNGHEVDTSAMLNKKAMFAIDASEYSVNGRNMVQVTDMPIGTDSKSVLMVVPNPTVTSGTLQEVGLDSKAFDMIDAIVKNDVSNGFTSAQMAVVKDGKLVYSNAWGTVNAYNPDGTLKTDSPAVTTETLYDLASNTKMYATNYAVQYLVQKGADKNSPLYNKLKLTDPITKFFPTFASDTIEIKYSVSQGTGAPDLATAKAWKAELTVQDILQHQAGFAPDPQFHNDKFNQVTQKPDQTSTNPLYAVGKDKVAEAICKAPLVYEPGTKTVYSDVDYMLLGLIVEQVTGKDLDTFLKDTFYTPLGLDNITFNPLEHGFTASQIAATELNGNSRDGAISFTGIREGTIQGTVHDEKAWYSMGGVSGHAGLFSNAEDLAKLAQLMLNQSGYGTNRLFSNNVNSYFTARKDALPTWGQGWWRQGDLGRPWYFGVQASRNTIGHQGWTGTLTMIDPAEDLVVVYLTNKINSPVTDNTVNANQFDGNWYTSSTLGFVANILYQGIESQSAAADIQPALDALLGDMAIEKMRLVAEEGEIDASHPIMKSAYALSDLVFDVAEVRPTTQNIQNAKVVISSLDASRDAKVLSGLNARMDILSPSAPSGGDSSSNTTTTTKKNDDGSTTVTVTNKTTGTVTATTTWPDGRKTVVETKKDGTVTAAVTLPAGKTAIVSIPVKNVSPGTVVYAVGDDGTKTLVRKSVVSKDGVNVLLDGSAKLELADNSKSFSDVPDGNWASAAVSFATARELFQGTGGDKFSPDLPMTRGMLVTVLHRLEDEPKAGNVPFGDVDASSWYAAAVAWASGEGIVLGTGNGFSPDATITRESLAVMLYRFAQKQGIKTSIDGTTVASFADSAAISPWAAEAMNWVVANGILSGKTGNLLDPGSTATRAEVATMLMRFVQSMVK